MNFSRAYMAAALLSFIFLFPSSSMAVEPFFSGSAATAFFLEDGKPDILAHFRELQKTKALHEEIFNAWRMTPDPVSIADAILGSPVMRAKQKPRMAFSLILQKPGEKARGILRLDSEETLRMEFSTAPRQGLMSRREFMAWSRPRENVWKTTFIKQARIQGQHSSGPLSESFIEPFQRYAFIASDIPENSLHKVMDYLGQAGIVIGSVRYDKGKWLVAGEIFICAD